MDEPFERYFKDNKKGFDGLQMALQGLKIMLWASDYYAARKALKAIVGDYGEQIRQSLEVKREIVSKRREMKAEIQQSFEQDGLKGQKLESAVQRRLSELTKPETEDDLASLAISPIASLITRFDTRIAEETGHEQIFDKSAVPSYQQPLFDFDTDQPDTSLSEHDLSGFRYLIISEGDGSWQMRSYRLHPPEFRIDELVRAVQHRFRDSVEIVREDDTSKISWPVWLRLFNSTAYIEATVFDPGRTSATMTLRGNEDPHEFVEEFLSAIAECQRGDVEQE